MASDPDKPSKGEDLPFDAVKAAEELAASLGIETPAGSETGAAAYEATLEREVEELNALCDAKDSKVRELEAALVKAAASRDEAHDQVEQVAARVVKEELKKREQKHRKMLLEFLEVLDDFDRALVALEEGVEPDSILDGIELVRNGFVRRLNEIGVVHLPSISESFDPNLHEAVTLVPVKDVGQDGVVVAVVREGYMIGDECLRPARVAVGKKS